VKQFTGTDRACGIAAATVAHDLNSEFTVILSSVASAMVEIAADHPARAALDEVAEAVHRCACKCSDLLVFASRHGVQPSRSPLAAVMQL
jgi:C4-dicarboxylate-specific signal transduction histidine kinase